MDNKFSSFSLNAANSNVYSSSSKNLTHQSACYPQNAELLINEHLHYSTHSLLFGVNQLLSNPVRSFPMGHHRGPDFCGIQAEEKKNRLTARNVVTNKRKGASSSILRQARSTLAFRNIMEDNFQNKNGPENSIPNTIYSLDGECLKRLLTKKLKPSDIGFLSRIVLPKKEAEENLPTLSSKEGIEVVLKDVYTDRQWSMKYKYWYNNSSRMYILENTGDFVMHYGFQVGDSLTLYGDECKNLYVLPKEEQTLKVAEPPLASKEGEQQVNSNNHNNDEEEEEVSFAMLMDELNQKEQENANNNGGSSTTTLLHNNASPKKTSEESLDDFFEGIDMSQFGCNFFP